MVNQLYGDLKELEELEDLLAEPGQEESYVNNGQEPCVNKEPEEDVREKRVSEEEGEIYTHQKREYARRDVRYQPFRRDCSHPRRSRDYSRRNHSHRGKYRQDRSPGRERYNNRRHQGPQDPEWCTVVVLLTSEPCEEIQLRKAISQTGYKIYDCMFPFRTAARNLLTHSNYSRSVEKYAQMLRSQTSEFFGDRFVVDDFLKWLQHQKYNLGKVVVCGLNNDQGSIAVVEALRKAGAHLVARGKLWGDYNFTSEESLCDRLNHLVDKNSFQVHSRVKI